MSDPTAPEPPQKDGTNGSKKLDHILIYPEDKREMDRLFGSNISYAKRQRAVLDVLKRERMVDKVRRKMLDVAEAAEGLIGSGITGVIRRSVRESPFVGGPSRTGIALRRVVGADVACVTFRMDRVQ